MRLKFRMALCYWLVNSSIVIYPIENAGWTSDTSLVWRTRRANLRRDAAVLESAYWRYRDAPAGTHCLVPGTKSDTEGCRPAIYHAGCTYQLEAPLPTDGTIQTKRVPVGG